MKFLRLAGLFVFRTIREERFLSFLSIIGVALGTGLFIGVKVASDRAVASFEAKVRGISPSANYEVLDVSGIDFKEEIYRELLKLDEGSIPELKTTAYVPALREAVDLHGIYTVKAMRYLGHTRGGEYDLEDFFRQPNGVLIAKGFADRYELKKGDEIKVLVYNREYALKVLGTLGDEAQPGNSLIMDLGNFQDYFDKTGYLTKIDLAVDEGRAEEIRHILPPDLALEKTEGLLRNQRSLLTSFRYNIQLISLIAVLVGLFLLYNTIFISVIKRRTEIGILRGLGADKKTVVMLFAVQGMVLGLAGSLLGVAVGQVAAYFAAFAIGKTVSSIYGGIPVTDYAVTARDALTALFLGVVMSVLASLVPAWESSKVRPNESFRTGSFEGRYRGYRKYFSAAGICLIASGGLMAYADYRSMHSQFPLLSYLGILLLIGGFTFLSPHYLSVALGILKRPVERVFGATGTIALGDMNGNVYRFSVALMSVAISCSLIVALLTLIFSFRNSLETWIRRTISADVYVKPASCTS
ncbi:MAG TPA: FtsX-like permease family protein, partial [Thermodesulfovibrionales bacterium]|nr:FtsX-like permease family protein [Thermodesulfovibrionales bacterium]